MTIHPATAKSAAKHEIVLSLDEDQIFANLKDGRVFVQAIEDQDASGFLKTILAALEYEADGFEGIDENEAVSITQAEAGEDFVAYLVIGTGANAHRGELARDPILADLLSTLDETEDTMTQVEGIREDAQPEDEEETSGSVVPDTFKKRYAEAGHPGHCGDWLAETLNALCQTKDGKKVITDLDRLEAIANANDVSPDRVDKLGTATNGWQGRYRMTVRNMLAKKVADKGFLFVPEGCGVGQDTEMPAPAEFCLKYATKVKAKKPAPEAAVAKDEGAGKASAKTQAAKPAKEPKAPKAKPTQAEVLAAAKAKHQK